MATGEYENGGLLKWRVNSNTTRIEELERWRREVDDERATMKERLDTIIREQRAASEDLKSFRRMIFIGTITAACSSVTFALTVLAGTGRL